MKRKRQLPDLIEVEFEDLPKFRGWVDVDLGDENLYFTHNGQKYFCKCL